MKFRLTNASKENSSIAFDHFENGTRIKYGLGLVVKVKYWNEEKQRVRSVQGYSQDAILINDQLDNVQVGYDNYMQDCKRLGEQVLKESLIYQIDLALGRVLPSEVEGEEPHLSLVELAQQYLDDNPHNIKSQSIVAKTSSLVAIKTYNAEHSIPIDFETMDLNKRTSFIKFHEKEHIRILKNGKPKVIEGKKPNTIWKYIKDLKTFLRYAEEEKGYEVNQAYKRRGFGVGQKEVEDIYLTPEEIDMLADADISKLPDGHKLALDVFLVGCHTGLRFSDVINLTPDNIKKGERLSIHTIQQKTGNKVIIPVKKAIEPILKKLPFKSISNQNLNRAIKEIAEKAELDKAQEISSHTARRSFATNAYRAGMRVKDIMVITGHKKETSFLRYLKITLEETAEAIGKHSFMQ